MFGFYCIYQTWFILWKDSSNKKFLVKQKKKSVQDFLQYSFTADFLFEEPRQINWTMVENRATLAKSLFIVDSGEITLTGNVFLE